MKLERSFNLQSPEAVSFRVSESKRTQNNNLEVAITPREIILFSRVDGEKDTEASDQAPEISQTAEPTETKLNSDWEPFNAEPHPSQNFVNLYSGLFSTQMELNRKNAERLIQVAALEGNIFLTSLQASRTRSLEVTPDWNVTTKRGLFWGEKPEDVENPYHRVASIPEGWRVEICDQRIRDELSEKYSGEKLQKKFVEKFNQHLRAGVWQAVWREKLTSEKDSRFVRKLRNSLLYPTIVAAWSAFDGLTLYDLGGIGALLLAYGMNNVLPYFKDDGRMGRSLRSFYEYFMPPIEVDRVLRGLAFVNLKGRNLVRLRQDSGEINPPPYR